MAIYDAAAFAKLCETAKNAQHRFCVIDYPKNNREDTRFVDTSKQRGDYIRKAKIAVVLAICVGTVMLLSGCEKPYSSYKLSDYIKVGDYKGLKVEKYKVAVSDKEINKEIKC